MARALTKFVAHTRLPFGDGAAVSGRRWNSLHVVATTCAGRPPVDAPETPILPFYPETVAKERKSLINAAVASTPAGHIPRAPNGYLEEENLMWRAIFQNVSSAASRYACREYLRALHQGAAYREDAVPDIAELNERVERQTGWQVAPCVGSLPPSEFFMELEARRMPCTMYIRPHTKYTFTEDPDCVHEMLGHIPHLFIPSWARLYQAFGRAARRLTDRGDKDAYERLILMYFAVVEKGLVRDGPHGEVKAIGASVISGAGELGHALTSPERHLPLEVDLVMKYGSTDEDGFMERYFVGEGVDHMADFVIDWMSTL
mmetsp:Transcript_18084/g.51508  ORF Transcript_18084/g.51508 Transcript_18084/m.51508 type:complete len:317 (+) Transcript_18084:52-1002(+)